MKQACGDLRGAIEDYKRTVELDPEDAVTWNNLGLLEEQRLPGASQERYRVSDELLGSKERASIPRQTHPPSATGPSANPAHDPSPE